MSDSAATEWKGPHLSPLTLKDSSDEQAPMLFKSVLCNTQEERNQLSNAIHFWDLISKYSAEHAHLKEKLPDVHEREFSFRDKLFRMTLFPGTIYHQEHRIGEPETTRRYPGAKEQLVEQALIKLGLEQARMQELKGRMPYQVAFSIKNLREVLQSLGSGANHQQIQEALEILSTSLMTISDKNGRRIHRSAILPGLSCIGKTGQANKDLNAQ